jgi:predicted PurR-regulated permease PerM
MTTHRLQHYFFFILVVTTILLLVAIFYPFLGSVTLGATFAVLFQPLYSFILRLVRGQESVAAFLTSTFILLMVIAPLALFGYQIFVEARQLYFDVNTTHDDLPTFLRSFNAERLDSIPPWLALRIDQYVQQALENFLQRLGGIFSEVAHVMLSLFISLLALYYLLKDGSRLRHAIIKISPLFDRYDKQIFSRLHNAVTSVVFGSLAIAALQGAASGAGLFLFGIPNAAFWGAVGIVAALVPTVGTALVIAPATFYLLLKNDVVAAIGLVLWGVTAVGLIDNILGPKLIERGLHIHPFLILLAVLGGLTIFGPIGFLIGPLILSLSFALLDIYPLLIAAHRRSTKKSFEDSL